MNTQRKIVMGYAHGLDHGAAIAFGLMGMAVAIARRDLATDEVDEWIDDTCPECDGSGAIECCPEPGISCDECEGAGVAECGNCFGEGRVEPDDSDECRECGQPLPA